MATAINKTTNIYTVQEAVEWVRSVINADQDYTETEEYSVEEGLEVLGVEAPQAVAIMVEAGIDLEAGSNAAEVVYNTIWALGDEVYEAL